MSKSNGCTIWSGNSLIDNTPIVVLLTGLQTPSNNSKTGWMLQTYVIRQDIAPTEAVKQGLDFSICGDCPMRGKSSDRTCYVNLIPVNNVWRKYCSGSYPTLNSEILQNIKRRRLPLRITAYGDAAATPMTAWEPLLNVVDRWTGYTHQWRDCDRRWQKYLMASVESKRDLHVANSMGWRTFRVILPEEKPEVGEIMCTHVAHESVQCEDCGLCNGTTSKSHLNIVDPVHGLQWKKNAFRQIKK